MSFCLLLILTYCLFILLSTLYSLLSTLYSLLSTLYSLLSTLYPAASSLSRVQVHNNRSCYMCQCQYLLLHVAYDIYITADFSTPAGRLQTHLCISVSLCLALGLGFCFLLLTLRHDTRLTLADKISYFKLKSTSTCAHR
jgi:hypothetical protein